MPHIDRFRARAGELLAEPPGITLWTQISSARLRRFSPPSSMLRRKAFGAFYRFGSPAEAAKQRRAAVDAVPSERLRRNRELDPWSAANFSGRRPDQRPADYFAAISILRSFVMASGFFGRTILSTPFSKLAVTLSAATVRGS